MALLNVQSSKGYATGLSSEGQITVIDSEEYDDDVSSKGPPTAVSSTVEGN